MSNLLTTVPGDVIDASSVIDMNTVFGGEPEAVVTPSGPALVAEPVVLSAAPQVVPTPTVEPPPLIPGSVIAPALPGTKVPKAPGAPGHAARAVAAVQDRAKVRWEIMPSPEKVWAQITGLLLATLLIGGSVAAYQIHSRETAVVSLADRVVAAQDHAEILSQQKAQLQSRAEILSQQKAQLQSRVNYYQKAYAFHWYKPWTW